MIYIGTSGWSYSHWRGVFYPKELSERKWLEFYADQFNAVELNTSFYRLPKEKTFRGWYERTPDSFLFSVKGSRFITHVKRLKDCREPLENLLEAAGGLKEKLGPVFFQFSPALKKNAALLESFTRLLPDNGRFAFEFRHSSWFCDDVYALLGRAGCAFVAADTPKYPYEEVQTTDFMYLRLHGRKQLYASSYTKEQLKEYAKKIKKWLKTGDVYVFFDNDAEANAVKNASELMELVSFKS